MKRTVMKLGGSILGGPADAASVLEVLASNPGPLVVVVSALRGVTERLLSRLAGRGEGTVATFVEALKSEHLDFIAAFGAPVGARLCAKARVESLCAELEALLEGEAPDRRTRVASFGERLSAPCVEAAFAALGRKAPVLEPGELGLVAIGSAEDSELDFATSRLLVRARLSGEFSLVVPGFHAPGADGLVHLFGRGGSDYSAACLAAIIGAEACVLVKDSGSLLTADPRLVPEARPVAELSYAEASALARGGAKIIHHRAVDPLAEAGVPLLIVGSGCSGGRTIVGAASGTAACAALGEASPRAIALAQGPDGEAALTVAGEGASAEAAARALAAIEAAKLGPWTIEGGSNTAAFRVVVDGSVGALALRAVHAALFEAQVEACRP